MANTTSVQTVYNSPRTLIVQADCVYVDAGSDILVNKSSFTGPNGLEPTELVVQEIRGNVQGFEGVRLAWDHTTDDEICILTGSDYLDFRPVGGFKDPAGAGGTGDILVSALGTPTAGDTWDITIHCKKKD